MTRELKIGAGLGLFVVAVSAWFFYARSSDHADIPLQSSQPVLLREPTEDSKKPEPRPSAEPTPGRSKEKPSAKPSSADRTTGKPEPRVTRSPSPRTAGKPPATKTPGRAVKHGSGSARPATNLASAEMPARKTQAQTPGGTKPKTRADGAARNERGLKKTTSGAPLPKKSRPTGTRLVPEFREHAVQPGESFALIAERYYGSQRHMSYLIQANPQVKDPAKLSIGQILRIPPPPTEPPREPAKEVRHTPAERTYTVRQGDCFYDIAQRELGSGNRWPEIYERNKDLVGRDPSNLRAGMALTLPAK